MSTAFGARLGWGRSPVLLLVDAVAAYTEPDSPLHLATASAAVEVQADLVRAARAGGCPVVWTTVTYAPGGREAMVFREKVPALACFEPGTGLGGWPPAVEPGPGDWVVTKRHASAFFGTDLASGLTALGVDTVVIGGFSTSGCVRATAVDAVQHGWRPMVVGPACADRNGLIPDPHEANLRDLDAKYADVVGVGESVAHLQGAS